MSQSIDKLLVEKRFTRSIKSYDQNACIQKKIAEELAQSLPSELIAGGILEVGCGTGLFSTLLRKKYPDRELLLNDLCEAVQPIIEEKISSPFRFLHGDAENMPWPSDLSLLASSSCIQWWQEPLRFIGQSARHLQEGGHLLFSTFGPQQMYELTEVMGGGLRYYSREELAQEMEEEGFQNIQTHERCYTLYFESLMALLLHLRHTGVNGTIHSTPLTASQLKELEKTYRLRYGNEKGELALSYQAIFVSGQKSKTNNVEKLYEVFHEQDEY